MISTREEAEAHQRKHGFGSLLENPAPIEVKPVETSISKARLPNKTEAAFGQILEARRLRGELSSVQFEAIKLRIGDRCYYTPDWMVLPPNWDSVNKVLHEILGDITKPTFFEVKGAHIWDDSIVKFKAAAHQHPWADFQMWQKKGGEWRRIH